MADLEGAAGEVDVVPAQGESLRAAHAEDEQDDEQRVEPVVACRLEESSRVSRCQWLTLAGPRSRHADKPGDVARDQLVAYGVFEGGAQRGVGVLHGARADAAIAQPVQEQPHVPGGETT